MSKPPVTPHHMRAALRALKIAREEYRLAARAALSVDKSRVILRERAVGAAVMARLDYRQALAYVAECKGRGVEVGAAWSPRGLGNVRAAARRR
jgi:hypothetical protein